MKRTLLSLALIAGLPGLIGIAHADDPQGDDELLRVAEPLTREDLEKLRGLRPDRLKPGGGLFVSFDTNIDGQVDKLEIDEGIAAAFADADTSGDGYLSVLEQQDWAAALATGDSSLSNPVRFDPNLDRRISFEEFDYVIQNLASDYTKSEADYILIKDLEQPKPNRRDEEAERPRQRPDGDRRGPPGQNRTPSSVTPG
ncbi:MAG: EF-hand domain-containing protein [Henriciella sp.]|nr:EF-hand domain-containing protein [Henriciella sp.]